MLAPVVLRRQRAGVRTVRGVLPVLLLSAAGVAAPLHAGSAQSKAVGRWIVHYEHETRGIHVGTPQVVVDTMRMTLRQRGDSIIGEWQAVVPAGGTPARPRDLRGVLRGETVRLELDPSLQESEGYFAELGREIVEFLKEHVHGIPPMTAQFELAVRGDSLVGARWSASADGSAETPRRKLWALREKP